MLYDVVKYFNYRKDVSFEILKIFYDLNKSQDYAFECAERNAFRYNENVVDRVGERSVDLDNDVIVLYTNGNGYCRDVFAVVEIPDQNIEK